MCCMNKQTTRTFADYPYLWKFLWTFGRQHTIPSLSYMSDWKNSVILSEMILLHEEKDLPSSAPYKKKLFARIATVLHGGKEKYRPCIVVSFVIYFFYFFLFGGGELTLKNSGAKSQTSSEDTDRLRNQTKNLKQRRRKNTAQEPLSFFSFSFCNSDVVLIMSQYTRLNKTKIGHWKYGWFCLFAWLLVSTSHGLASATTETKAIESSDTSQTAETTQAPTLTGQLAPKGLWPTKHLENKTKISLVLLSSSASW